MAGGAHSTDRPGHRAGNGDENWKIHRPLSAGTIARPRQEAGPRYLASRSWTPRGPSGAEHGQTSCSKAKLHANNAAHSERCVGRASPHGSTDVWRTISAGRASSDLHCANDQTCFRTGFQRKGTTNITPGHRKTSTYRADHVKNQPTTCRYRLTHQQDSLVEFPNRLWVEGA
jgi:hypothetical protein